MPPELLIFITASTVVVAALLYALMEWTRIYGKATGLGATAATLFMTCFTLYSVGQTWVILQALRITAFNDYPSYCYALAAILFAVGSYYQRKSTEQ